MSESLGLTLLHDGQIMSMDEDSPGSDSGRWTRIGYIRSYIGINERLIGVEKMS